MKMLHTLAAAAVLMCAAGTAHAQGQQKQEVNGWTIYSFDDNCRAIASFQNGTTVSIAIYAKNTRSSVMILNDKAFASAKQGEPFDAKLAFVKGDDLITDWMSLNVIGIELDGGSKGAYIGTTGDGLLKSFGSSDVAGLLRDTEAVARFPIGADGPPVEKALRQCVAGK